MWRHTRPKKATLERLYHDQEMSLREIGEQYGVSASTVWRWMEAVGIERRDAGRQSERPACEELFDLRVNQRLTIERLAEHYGVSTTAIRGWLKQCAIPDALPPRSLARRLPRDTRLERLVASTTDVPRGVVRSLPRPEKGKKGRG